MDFGFDFASLNNRLYGSFDYFYYSTKGYLVAPRGDSYLNTALGVGLPRVKSDSEHRRAGFELQLAGEVISVTLSTMCQPISPTLMN